MHPVKVLSILLCDSQKSINDAATDWGLQCLRYEIRKYSIHARLST